MFRVNSANFLLKGENLSSKAEPQKHEALEQAASVKRQKQRTAQR